MKRINGKFVFFILAIIVFAILGFLYLTSVDKSDEGKIPSVDEDKYVIALKEAVFTQAFNGDNSWVEVVNKRSSRTKLQLCIELDSVYFTNPDILLGYVIKTSEEYTDFSWDTITENETRLLYFSLPIETIVEIDKFDYVSIPTWLLSTLIDEEVMDIEVDSIRQKKTWDLIRNN